MKERIIIIILFFSLGSLLFANEEYRTIQRNSKIQSNGQSYKVGDFGKYYAILIYVQDYLNLKDLKTPKKDVEALAKILKNRYGFVETKIVPNPKNSDALIEVLDSYRVKLRDSDNLLIYYAGHGSKDGFWQLRDAKKNSRVGWIPVEQAVNITLKEMNSKHILVIADSCYSGLLTRDGATINSLNKSDKLYYSKLYRYKSRNVLTSGGLQPVIDQDSSNPNHSVFANGLLSILENNKKSIFSLEEKYPKIKRYVQLNSKDQMPLYGDVRMTGHQDGGDFIFLDRRGIVPPRVIEKKKVTLNKRKDVEMNIHISSNIVYITPSRGTFVRDGDERVSNLTNTILSKIDKNGKLSINQYNREFEFNMCGNTTHVLAIGVNEIKSFKSLKYAEIDAQRFVAKVKDSCKNVKSIMLLGKGATKDNILQKLKEVKNNKEDVVLFYFTGYALSINQESYIFPYNSSSSTINQVNKTALNINKIFHYFNTTEKESLIIIDSQIRDRSSK